MPQPAPLFLPFLHLLFFLLFSTSILIPGVELQATLYSFRSASSFTSNQSSLAVLFICFLQYLLSLCLFFYSIAPARAFYPLSPGLIKMTQIDLLACSFPPPPCYSHHLSLDPPASLLPGNTLHCLGLSSRLLFPNPHPLQPQESFFFVSFSFFFSFFYFLPLSSPPPIS